MKYSKYLALLMFIPLVMSQSMPQSVSPTMLKVFETLSPQQQKEFAKKYGIDIPATSGSSSKSTLGDPGDPIKEREPSNYIDNKQDLFDEKTVFDEYLEKSKTETIIEDERFGINFFSQEISTFSPVDDMPVPENYLLGVGDEIIIQLIGTENQTFYLPVQRDGSILIESVGPVVVSGLTFDQMQQLIKSRVSQQLIGVEALITMGRLKAMNIFMAGEVNYPGMYSVSALTTITQSLYQAGGISDIGSLRKIKVLRDGSLVTEFDAYSLLISGDASNDIRLRSGDVVLVPEYDGVATVKGEVKRPMVFEIKNTDSIKNLIKMAGYFSNNAYPTNSSLKSKLNSAAVYAFQNINLYDEQDLSRKVKNGDILTVPKAGEGMEQYVRVEGAANRTGFFGWKQGMRLSDLFQNSH